MIRRYLLPLLALLGIVIVAVAIFLQNRHHPSTTPAVPPPKAPFVSYVAGSGIIEPSSGDVAVGTPVPGIVTDVMVRWGDAVAIGDPLFRIDDADLRAQLPPALAARDEAEARLRQAEGELRFAESVRDKRAISVEELFKRRQSAAIATAAVKTSEARVRQIRLETERRTIRARVAGKVLRIAIRPGEFAPTGPPAVPLMVLGSETPLFLRVDVDEYDAWRVRPGSRAVAFLRGNPDLRTPLRFVRIDPYVIPKTSLTGRSTERVDTRVLQVIYRFDPSALPNTYPGQQMDVFIEAPPAQQGSPVAVPREEGVR